MKGNEDFEFPAELQDKEKKLRKQEQGHNETVEGSVPEVFRRIWGEQISPEKLRDMGSNSTWRELTIQVCDNCFMRFTMGKEALRKHQQV